MVRGVPEPGEHDYQYSKHPEDAVDCSVLNSLHGYRLEHNAALSLQKHLLGVRKVTTDLVYPELVRKASIIAIGSRVY